MNISVRHWCQRSPILKLDLFAQRVRVLNKNNHRNYGGRETGPRFGAWASGKFLNQVPRSLGSNLLTERQWIIHKRKFSAVYRANPRRRKTTTLSSKRISRVLSARGYGRATLRGNVCTPQTVALSGRAASGFQEGLGSEIRALAE